MIDTMLVQKIEGLSAAYGRTSAKAPQAVKAVEVELSILTLEIVSCLIDTTAYDGDRDDGRLLRDAKVVLLQACRTATVAEIENALSAWQATNDALCLPLAILG